MTYDARELARVRNPVLLISAVTWIALLLEPRGVGMLAHCPATSAGAGPLPSSFPALMAMNPLAALGVGWALMLVAMMLPALIAPLCHIRLRSFTRRRARGIALFVAGYFGVWMVLGGVLMAVELAAKLFAPQSFLPAASVVLIATVWQFSPFKQRCLNRCHAHLELAAFGAAADFDALRFGLTHGIGCAGSCWALMLVPMLLFPMPSPAGHVAAMAAVAVLIFSERLEPPMPPCWRWRGLGKVTRILTAQARIRYQLNQAREAGERS